MRETDPETLTAEDALGAKRWTLLVQHSSAPDVYYLPEYAQATAEIEQTEPIALIAGAPSSRILAPLLIRRTSGTMNGSAIEWLDASTPYGYGGLLNLSDHIRPETFHDFFHQLHGWCSDRRIVCCVIRLHPLIAQQDWFDPPERWQDRLQIHSRGFTTSIDLSKWSEKPDQPISLRRDRRADMRLAGDTLRVTWSTGADDDVEAQLGIFAALYHKLIDRNGADSFYRFPQKYFQKLTKLGKRLGIALAWYEDEPVGGNLFLAGPRFAHGHLAATNDIGRKYGASTFLIVEGARWARQRGCELLHLGGGMKPGDSLEDYKRSFGGSSHVYHYVTFIADRKQFDEICKLPTASWPYNLLDSTPGVDGRRKA
jgi:hypothetical protein